jgi:hypothetical protein
MIFLLFGEPLNIMAGLSVPMDTEPCFSKKTWPNYDSAIAVGLPRLRNSKTKKAFCNAAKRLS